MFNTSIGKLANQLESWAQSVTDLSAEEGLATIGGLLLCPGLQSNCVRLEALAHLILLKCNGQKAFTESLIQRAFVAANDTSISMLEDPAEDVFVGNINSQAGNRLVLEGIWESGGFYLQRFLGLVESMGSNDEATDVRNSVESLLAISNLLCQRADLTRNSTGERESLSSIPSKLCDRLNEVSTFVIVTNETLSVLGIDSGSLAPFTFEMPDDFESEDIGYSTLQRKPLIKTEAGFLVALPTAISFAIRSFVVEFATQTNTLANLEYGLVLEYQRFLRQASPFGSSRLPISKQKFRKQGNNYILEFLQEVDRGRFMHLFFIADNLAGVDETTVSGHQAIPPSTLRGIQNRIQQTHEQSRKQDGFREGCSIVVVCGVGRGFFLDLNGCESNDWFAQAIDASAFATLCDDTESDPILFFRLESAVKKLNQNGVRIFNINGFLNLLAWARSLKGNIVPHDLIPDELGEQGNAGIAIAQDAIFDLRHNIASRVDRHMVQKPSGDYVEVGRHGGSYFTEDRSLPSYLTPEEPFKVVYEGNNFTWWGIFDANFELPMASNALRWELVSTWLERIAMNLDSILRPVKKGDVLCWKVRFKGEFFVARAESNVERGASFDDVVADITIDCNQQQRTVTLEVGEEFESAMGAPDNRAEAALAWVAITSFVELTGSVFSEERIQEVFKAVVPNRFARQSHQLMAQSFRDYVAHTFHSKAVQRHDIDDATRRIGLGWLSNVAEPAHTVEGIEGCKEFLAEVVSKLESELCKELKKFNRKEFLVRILENHESAVIEKTNWIRTTPAVIALRGNSNSVRSTIIEHDSRMNSVCISNRLLMEIACCESPRKGGIRISDLELSRLSALALRIFHLGGISDAIRWRAMEPRLKIGPMGDIAIDHDFIDNVFKKSGNVHAQQSLDETNSTYDEIYKQPEMIGDIEGEFEDEFCDAWQEEFGVSLTESVEFVDIVENFAIERKAVVLNLSSNELRAAFGEFEREFVFDKLIDRLCLPIRDKWNEIPVELKDKFKDRDRQPWKFRRQLSLLQRPIIRLGSDCELVFAPGMLRDSLKYLARCFHLGELPHYQVSSKKMRSWSGRLADKKGAAFATLVADKLKELGWNVPQSELKLTKLLAKGFDRDYGDVDVFAWDESTGRVLVIECKDLQFKKTYGEVAEQLLDYRGDVKPNGKRDDLRKHLDRIAVINANADRVAKFCGLTEPDIRPILLFKNPVPMQYALDRVNELTDVKVFADLEMEFDLR